MKIGIYGGTFDPIHNGHLILGRDARETFGLDKIIFVVAAASPFKDPPVGRAEIRLSMLRAAVEHESGFVADDCELHRPPPSYTIDTVYEIQRREHRPEIYLLVGDDNVSTLPKWHRFNELQKLVRFVILERTGIGTKHDYAALHRRVDISATEIRKRVAGGQSISYLVPDAVEHIIQREKLYREQAK